MKYHVIIIRNSDGERREYQPKFEWERSDYYAWTDGNYGCDCNRHLFFHRAIGTEAPDDCPCGETAYTVPFAIMADGSKIRIDE